MTPRDRFWSIVRTWENGLTWQLEWDYDIAVWSALPCPPWEALA